MQEKFGIEIETLSNIYRSKMIEKIKEIIEPAKVSTNTDYHTHNVNQWAVESDGSLYGGIGFNTTAELITPPLKINELGTVKKVLDHLKENTMINKSCGLHVHVEVPNVETVKAILLIWRKFESHILKTFPTSRRSGNQYCHPISSISINDLFSFQNERYYQVNTTCYHSKGTVEFRGHAGTTDYRKIKRWVLFVTKLVEVAKSYSTKLNELAQDLEPLFSNDCFKFLGIESTKTAKYMEARIIHFEKLAA